MNASASPEMQALVAEMLGTDVAGSPPPPTAPTMGRLKRVSYSHAALIDTLITRPELSQNDLALMFGYTPGWISNILASDAFQAALARRRSEVVNPTIVATVEERARGLYIKSAEVLMEKLEKPVVSDSVATKVFELSGKALGLGGHAPVQAAKIDLEDLKLRLLALNEPKPIEGEVLGKEVI